MPGDFEVSFYAVVRGFYVYQATTVGEALALALALALATQREHSNLLMQHLPCYNYKRKFLYLTGGWRYT